MQYFALFAVAEGWLFLVMGRFVLFLLMFFSSPETKDLIYSYKVSHVYLKLILHYLNEVHLVSSVSVSRINNSPSIIRKGEYY